MSHHAPRELTDVDKAVLGAKADRPWFILTIGGLAAIALALVISLPTEHGVARFAFAYTVGFAFALAITLGNLFFVIITTLFRAGWCAAVRRVAECYAANILTLGCCSFPCWSASSPRASCTPGPPRASTPRARRSPTTASPAPWCPTPARATRPVTATPMRV